MVEKNIIAMELSLRDIRTIACLAEWRRIRLTPGAWRKPGRALKTLGAQDKARLSKRGLAPSSKAFWPSHALLEPLTEFLRVPVVGRSTP
jgi:hypothetical protein